MYIRTLLDFIAHDIQLTMREIVAEMCHSDSPLRRKRLFRKYELYRRLFDLHHLAANEGWEFFDWEKAAKEGWLCEMDHKSFKEARGKEHMYEEEQARLKAAGIIEQQVDDIRTA